MAKQCARCGVEQTFGKPVSLFADPDGEFYCRDCRDARIAETLAPIIVTTTPTVDGYRIQRYVGIESVEIVVGPGLWAEFTGAVDLLSGDRSTPFEKKMQSAKRAALLRLKHLAKAAGANAVVGIDLDYAEFAGNRVGIVANGTLVELVPLTVPPIVV